MLPEVSPPPARPRNAEQMPEKDKEAMHNGNGMTSTKRGIETLEKAVISARAYLLILKRPKYLRRPSFRR